MASINKGRSQNKTEGGYNGYVSKTDFLRNVKAGDCVRLIPRKYLTYRGAKDVYDRLFARGKGLSFIVKNTRPCEIHDIHYCPRCGIKIDIGEGAQCYSWEGRIPILEKVPTNK
jgi:hypothetical protein